MTAVAVAAVAAPDFLVSDSKDSNYTLGETVDSSGFLRPAWG